MPELHFRLVRRHRRKVLDAVDCGLDIIQNGSGVGEGRELDIDLSEPRGCGADNPLHPRQTDDALLDATIDVFLHFPRRRTREGNGDGHGSQVDGRKVLNGEVGAGDDAADDEEQHEQVGGDGIPGEIRDRSRFHGSARLVH